MRTLASSAWGHRLPRALLFAALGLNACDATEAPSGGVAGAAAQPTSNGGATQANEGGAGGQGSTGTGTGGRANPVANEFTKVDLLLMIDNSLGMAEKQLVLAAAVPQLLRRLTDPDCIDPTGVQAPSRPSDPTAVCPAGTKREFAPVNDIHLGVITSSLGDFGGDVCPEAGALNLPQNDHAWLLGALPRNASVLASPFLAWSPSDAQAYTTQMSAKVTELSNHILQATNLGCGNEMGLEAWYRFLVDPKPPVDVTTVNTAPNQRGPVDANLLQQRSAFLRPDSVLAVVMLSDENDCSMRDSGAYSWIAMTAGSGFRLWRGSTPCASNPNDPCCYSCMLAGTTSGISEECLNRDTTCRQNDASAKLAQAADDVNVRCRQTKRRFGYDFLFPPSRYVNALTKLELCPDQDYGDLDCNCAEAKAKGVACTPGASVKNPLFSNLNPDYSPTGPVRLDAHAVYLVGIVGVPWQDLARDPSAATLGYKRATELDWGLFAPKVNEDYAVAVLGDPLMIESFQPRVGTHPITGEALAAPDARRLANSINGHEWNTSDKDVQLACIFSLENALTATTTSAVRTCDVVAECGTSVDTDAYKVCARRADGCACVMTASTATSTNPMDPSVSKLPLCQAADNSYGNKQYFAKAYPGLRQLQVLRGFFETTASNNAVVGSICPKDLTLANRDTDGYGFNPVVKSLVDQLREQLLKN